MVKIYINGEIGQVFIGDESQRTKVPVRNASLRVWSPDLPLLGLVLWIGLFVGRLRMMKDYCLREMSSWGSQRERHQLTAAIRDLQELLEQI